MDRFAPARRAGALVLTSGFTGRGEDGADASSAAYAALVTALADQGLAAASVARLDHFTASQAWLAERQRARAAMFGKPALLVSTGVATLHLPGELLTVAAMAIAGSEIVLQASGAEHGMPAIAAAVRAGPLLFISGVLTSGRQSPVDQRSACLATIERLLADAGSSPAQLLRVDAFAGNGAALADLGTAIHARWPTGPLAIGGGVGHFPSDGQIEVNALALLDGAVTRGHFEGVSWVHGADMVIAGPFLADADGIDEAAAGIVDWLDGLVADRGATGASIARLELRVPSGKARLATLAELRNRLSDAVRPAMLCWAAPGAPAMMVTLDMRPAT